MNEQSVASVIVLTIITFGIYGIVWMVKTKNTMNAQGAEIPTAWLMVIPIVSIWWLWKYSEGVAEVSGNMMSAPTAFLLLFFLFLIGMAIIQSQFNSIAKQSA